MFILQQIQKANTFFGDPLGKASVVSLNFSKTSFFDQNNSLFPASLVSNNRTLPSVVSQIRELQRVISLSNKNMTGIHILYFIHFPVEDRRTPAASLLGCWGIFFTFILGMCRNTSIYLLLWM